MAWWFDRSIGTKVCRLLEPVEKFEGAKGIEGPDNIGDESQSKIKFNQRKKTRNVVQMHDSSGQVEMNLALM